MLTELEWVPPKHWVSNRKGWFHMDPGFWFCWYCCKAFGERKPKGPHMCEARQTLHDSQVALGWVEA